MSVFSTRLAVAVVLAALGLGAGTAHAQGVPYSWASGWSSGFRGKLSADQGMNANANGDSAGFANNSADVGAFMQRYSFSSNSFLGGPGFGSSGLTGLTGLNQTASFGSSFTYDGVQVGYNFKNSPVSVFAGFDTAKYNPGLGANPFSPFDTSANSTPGYTARAGVEFKPTSNLSLSLGASFTQAGTDNNTVVLPGASPFGVRR
jgi:opacity protein-like surface antigen